MGIRQIMRIMVVGYSQMRWFPKMLVKIFNDHQSVETDNNRKAQQNCLRSLAKLVSVGTMLHPTVLEPGRRLGISETLNPIPRIHRTGQE